MKSDNVLYIAIIVVAIALGAVFLKTRSKRVQIRQSNNQLLKENIEVRPTFENSNHKLKIEAPSSNLNTVQTSGDKKMAVVSAQAERQPPVLVEKENSILTEFSQRHKGFKIQFPLGMKYDQIKDEDGDWDAVIARNPNDNIKYIVAGTKFDIKDQDEAMVTRELFNMEPEQFEDVDINKFTLDLEAGLKPVYCFESHTASRTVSGCHVVSNDDRHFIVAVDGATPVVQSKEAEIDQTYDSMRSK